MAATDEPCLTRAFMEHLILPANMLAHCLTTTAKLIDLGGQSIVEGWKGDVFNTVNVTVAGAEQGCQARLPFLPHIEAWMRGLRTKLLQWSLRLLKEEVWQHSASSLTGTPPHLPIIAFMTWLEGVPSHMPCCSPLGYCIVLSMKS